MTKIREKSIIIFRSGFVILFFNSSLRTRLSTQKAAQNLGMEVMIMILVL
jgi:ornithine carbamoyltransferase